MSSEPARRILLVDDEPDNRNLVRQICNWLGYPLAEAVNGEEAVRLAKAEQPALILMDLAMPVLDGWAATAEIKAHPPTQDIPVVAFTAHVLIGERERALAAGCDDFLPKPLTLEAFVEVLGRYMGPSPAREPR